nr:glycosyltransferase family 4 protein [Pseudomonas sp. A46]
MFSEDSKANQPDLWVAVDVEAGAQEMERIDNFLTAQTLKGWQRIPDSDASASTLCSSVPILFIRQAPEAIRATALEEAVWHLSDCSVGCWLELKDHACGEDLFVRREARPESAMAMRRGGAAMEWVPQGHARELGKSHLLMLVPWLEPGGADRCNLDVLAALRDRGWSLTVVASLAAAHRWQHRFRQLTPDVWILPDFISAEKVPYFIDYLLATRPPSLLLISNSDLGYGALGLVRQRYRRLPIIDLNHMEEAWGGGGFPSRAVQHSAALDRHLVISAHLKDWLVSRGVDAQKVQVLRWFADTDRWKPNLEVRSRVRKQLCISEHDVLIAYAGRICRQKRPEIFVASLKMLIDRGIAVSAVVLGDGELSGDLREELKRSGLEEYVRMLGWRSEEGVREWFQAADIFFLPSAAEGIALVLYEAMAAGVAVVAAKVGGQAELVTPDCGFLVERSDSVTEVRRYADCLGMLAVDPVLLAQMKIASASRIREEFGRSQFESGLEHMLRSIDGSSTGYVSAHEMADSVARLSMQWRVYRTLTRLQRLPFFRSLWFERAVKVWFLVRGLGVGALWDKVICTRRRA